MKKGISKIIIFILGGVFFVSMLSYASTFNSEEISYDNSNSHAEATNVKDAIDWLYTNAGMKNECPENMSCVEKPGVIMNVTGPGAVDKETVYVGLNESSTFTVTPNDGYVLTKLECNNGYTLSSFSTGTGNIAGNSQIITIINPGTTSSSSCTIIFSTDELNAGSTNLHSTYKGDTCNSNSSGCICYQIKNNITNFSYEGHTGCNFKSTTCMYTYGAYTSQTFDCSDLYWGSGYHWFDGKNYSDSWDGFATCSGVITCAT